MMARAEKHPISQIVDEGLCVGCGFCTMPSISGGTDAGVEMTYDLKFDSFVPRIRHCTSRVSEGSFVCPGKTMNMVELALSKHGMLPDDYLLGTYRKLRIGYSSEPDIREKSASGGAIPAILLHLFRTNRIDAVYALHPGETPYDARGTLICEPGHLSELHGAVYHPSNFGYDFKTLVASAARFAFVGLPCQVAGLEMYKRSNPLFAQRHIISLGLFCGGVNKFGGIAYYLRGMGVRWDDVGSIRYRVGSWPGKIRVDLKTTEESVLIPRIRGNARWKILRYMVGFQGYWMLKRCRLCPDQINDFADIAVGDPHLPKYRAAGGAGFSVMISRTDQGESILAEMVASAAINAEEVDRSTVVASQGYTLQNRRHVQAYVGVNRWLRQPGPEVILYPSIRDHVSFQHYVYAWVDLIKVYFPKGRFIQVFYIPLQVFEYLFITFTPHLILKRLCKLFRNK